MMTNDVSCKASMPYEHFVQGVVALVGFYDSQVDPFVVFPDPCRLRGGDYRIEDGRLLKGSDGAFFYVLAARNAEVFGFEPSEFELKCGLASNTPYVEHACYRRNLQRWAGVDGDSPTLPRKKRCRVDLCLMACCWALGFGRGEYSHLVEPACTKLLSLCAEFVGEVDSPANDGELLSLVWLASSAAYRGSVEAKRTEMPESI